MQYTEPLRRGPSATRFSLIELVLLLSCSAIACALLAQGVVLLAFCFLSTVLAFRTSIVDFSLIGGLAVIVTIVFGTMSIGLLILWSIGW